MPVITLPDGSQRHFDHAVSPMDVALDIGPGLAKATIAGRVNGELVDACDLIENDATSLSSPRKMKKVWRSFVTPVRTC
jgi:threonyl-tRNA synthetase